MGTGDKGEVGTALSHCVHTVSKMAGMHRAEVLGPALVSWGFINSIWIQILFGP